MLGRHRLILAAVIVAVAAGVTAGIVIASTGGTNAHRPTTGSPLPASNPNAQQPQDVRVAPGQLSVAEELGPDIVAAQAAAIGGHLKLVVRGLTGLELPAAVPLTLPQATITGRCGPGCYDASVARSTQTLIVHAKIHGTSYVAQLPIEYRPNADSLARTLLDRLDAAQVKLRSAVVHQSLRASPTTPELTVFEIQAPDRFAYQLSLGGRSLGDTIIAGTTEWSRSPGQRRWQPSSYGTQPFSAAGYLDWWASSAGSPRLLDLYRAGSTRIADIAALSNIPQLGPVWYRLHIDLTHDRLLRLRMITIEHFMTQTWAAFNTAQQIRAPTNTTATSK